MQLPEGPFSFTTTVRVAFEDPSDSQGDLNADGEFSAEDGAADFVDLHSASERSPNSRSEEETQKRHRSDVGRPWTQAEDNTIIDALRQGWQIRRIYIELLPQRSYAGLQKHIERNFSQFTDISDPAKPLPFTKGCPKLPFKETSKDALLDCRMYPNWTGSEDAALVKAYNQGLSVASIYSDIFPQRTYNSVHARLALLCCRSKKPDDNSRTSLSGVAMSAAGEYPNPSATDAKADIRSCPLRWRHWTYDEEMALVEARNQGWSYIRIRDELLPDRTLAAMKRRYHTCIRWPRKPSTSDKPRRSRYGAFMENDAVDDEEFPPLPKEGDLKRITEENSEEDDKMAQEEEHHADYPWTRSEHSEELKKQSLNLAEGNYTDVDYKDLATLQEEVEDMDIVVDDNDMPHLVIEDGEGSKDYTIAAADDDSEDEVAREDYCDDS